MANELLSPEGLQPIEFPEAVEAAIKENHAQAEPPAKEATPEKPTEEMSIPEADEAFEATFLKQLDGESPEPEAKPVAESEPEDSSPAAANFKKIKQDRDNIRNERDGFKSEIEELRKKLGDMDDSDVNGVLNEVTKQRDHLDQQLKVANLERHPEFQQKYQNKIKQIVETTKSAVGEEYAERMGELVQMNESSHRDQQIEEIMGELTQTQQARMGALLTRMDEVRSEKADALNNADTTYSELMEQQSAADSAQFAADEQVFSEVSGGFTSNLEAFQQREGDDEWNADVQARLETAKQLFSGKGNSAQDLIEATHWAVAGPFYRSKLVEAMELNKRLRGENKDMAGATPTATTSDAASDSSGAPNFEEAFAQMTGMDVSSYR